MKFRWAAVIALGTAAPLLVGVGSATAGGPAPAVASGAPAGPCDDVDAEAVAGLPTAAALETVDALSSFGAAVAAAGIDLTTGGPFTVFAATDEAIEAIPQHVFDALLADQALLESLISYHVVAGQALTGADLVELGSIETLNGPVTITSDGTTMSVNDALVVCPEIQTADAVVFVIDRVLQPPTDALGGCPGSSVPGSSVPGSSVPGSSVPC